MAQMVELHYFAGLEYAEIAAALSISPGLSDASFAWPRPGAPRDDPEALRRRVVQAAYTLSYTAVFVYF